MNIPNLIKYAVENNIKTIVIPSTTGKSVSLFEKFTDNINLIVVTKSSGIKNENEQAFDFTKTQNKRIKVLTTTHSFGGINRALKSYRENFSEIDICANTLRIFGDGVKVAVEISLMTTDAGLTNSGESIIACGGEKNGVDKAIVIQCTNSHRIFDAKIFDVFSLEF